MKRLNTRGWSVWYCTLAFFGKALPWFINVGLGLFVGEITVPVAILSWICVHCGVATPFIR